ncbi:MAG TPA: hypothetical protein VFP84_35105 [Kofleriaceae bacterium]|nr:hypothetical protein [Kofleriaceae bacterium]
MIGGSRCIAAVLASCLVVAPVLADPKPVSDKDKQVASDLVKKAIARSQAGDHSAAIDIYLQAYTIVPNSILLSNIGSEFEKSGKQEEALHYFCLYLEKDPNGTNVVYATSQAKQLQAMLGTKHVTDDNMCDPAKPKRGAKHTTADDPDEAPDEPDAPVKPKREAKPAPAPEAQGDPGLRHAGIGVGIAGALLVGVGIYAGVQAKNISDEISGQNVQQMWPQGIRNTERRGQNYEYLQIGALIGGAAALGVGIYLYVRGSGSDEAAADPDKAKDKADRERTVHLTPTANGVALFGKF